ncbi:MAG: type I secretion system permease/ATPase [Desulfovibrio sp.]
MKEKEPKAQATPANDPMQHKVVSMTLDEAKEDYTDPLVNTSIDYNSPILSCIASVFRLNGHAITTEALMSGLPVSQGPITVLTASRAAERAGMKTRVMHRPDLMKISRLVLPCIALLKNNNACVLLSIDGDNAEVLLPEKGSDKQIVSVAELSEDYSGYALFCTLPGKLDARASKLKLLDSKKWFWGTIFKFVPVYRHVILASIMVNLLAIASPLFIKNIYDRVVPNNAVDTLWVLSIGIVLAYTFDLILKNLRSYFVDVAGKGADIIIASKLLQQVMGLRYDHKPESTGTLANNIREFESLRDFFSSTTLLSLVDLPFLAVFIALIFFLAGPIGWVPLVAVPIVILVGAFLQYPFQRIIEQGFKESAQKNALLYEIIDGLETVKTNTAEGQMQNVWEKAVGMSATSQRRSKLLANISITFSQYATQLVSLITIVWGVYLIAEGNLTMGGLIASNILVGRAMAPLGAVAALLTRFQQSRMALKSLDLLMQLPNERPVEKDYINQGEIEKSITFENVSFKYPETERAALDRMNFHIRQGEKVAIIGKMGSGKSTVSRLALGLYMPTAGAVKVGGIDVRQWDIADLRQQMAYVAQDNYLFYGSIRDNIAFGLPYVDDAAILRAAEVAGVVDFVRRHPAGFGMPVGERGTNLSGGQRQAVTIARALLKDPDILIMDEPSSSMDSSVEIRLRKNLEKAIQDKTVVIITHSNQMLKLVDRIIVVDNGKVLADGPRDKVLEALKNDKIRTRRA